MPVFSIETPGGKILDIEAADEAAAVQGAKEWDASNGATSKLERAWNNPPSGPSIIGAARGAYDAALGLVGNAAGAVAPMPANMTEEDQFRQNQARDTAPIQGFQTAMAVSPMSAGGAPALSMGGTLARAPKPVVAGPSPSPLMQAAGDLNLTLPKILATDSPAAQRMGASISSMPIVGEPIRNAVESTVSRMGQISDDLARLGGAASPILAGQEAKSGITNFIRNTSKDTEGFAHQAVRDIVDPAATHPLTNTESMLNTINLRRSSAARGPSSIENEFKDALSRDGLTVEGIKDLRSSFGPNVRHRLTSVKGLEEGEIKQVYGALTRDYENAVYAAGGDRALSALKEANAVSRLQNIQRKALEKIVGPKADAAPESVFEKIVAMAGSRGRADAQKLNLAKLAMGDRGWGEVSSAVISRLGRDADGRFSPDRFLTGYGNLSDAGKRTLFGGNKGLDTALNNLATVSRGLRDKVGQFQNNSRTAPTMMGAMGMAGLLSAPLATLGTAIGGHIMARALAEPVSVRTAAQWVTAVERAATQPTKGNVNSLRAASKMLAISIARASGGNVGEITRQIESVVAGSADGNSVLPSGERQ